MARTHVKTICVDCDGVIADYSRGFRGPAIIGMPLPGAKEFLWRLHELGWRVIIFSSRGTEIIKKYMAEHDLYFDYINDNPHCRGLNSGKPIADIYLDDRGMYFTGDYNLVLEMIEDFRPWYRQH